jgi:hypothetical protein
LFVPLVGGKSNVALVKAFDAFVTSARLAVKVDIVSPLVVKVGTVAL